MRRVLLFVDHVCCLGSVLAAAHLVLLWKHLLNWIPVALPQDLNPFAPAETSQYAPYSRGLQQAMPTNGEAEAAADFRNVSFLARYLTETGRVVPRRKTHLQVTFPVGSVVVL